MLTTLSSTTHIVQSVVTFDVREIKIVVLAVKTETEGIKKPYNMSGKIENTIRAIDPGSVHRICSGQVILSLGIAVKELVENSVDAGATHVEVKLVDHGKTSITVSDNGKGIQPHNFQALTLKHHTSKLSEFTDLDGVSTFGFRGEALSSLCAMTETMSVVTRHSSQNVGTRLLFDQDGRILSQETAPRAVGTDVKLASIFTTMPVRLKEFERNLKREFAKMVKILQAYCLGVASGVRISCTNVSGSKQVRTVVISSNGSSRLADRIVEVFGTSQMANLREIPSTKVDDFTFRGYVSVGEHGKGRSAPDRQFYFINGRPCDPAKVSKMVNEVYHGFNRHQYPFVVLLVESTDSVDVNLTPDKRKILIANENALLDALKDKLNGLFESSSFTVPTSHQPVISAFAKKLDEDMAEESSKGKVEQPPPPPPPVDINISNLKALFGSRSQPQTAEVKSPPPKKARQTTLKSHVFSELRPTIESEESLVIDLQSQPGDSETETKSEPCGPVQIQPRDSSTSEDIQTADIAKEPVKNDIESLLSTSADELSVKVERKIVIKRDDMPERAEKKVCFEVVFSLERIQCQVDRGMKADDTDKVENYRRFYAPITPDDNTAAEAELAKEIGKSDFEQMKIFGDRIEDLFIIDQHATDEKYNFERLQKTERLQSQRLTVPQNLALPPTSQSILTSNMEAFNRNGFEFDQDLKLVKIPISRNWTFGKADIEELLFMLSEDNSDKRVVRPTRIRAMFASRACRSSIMIGTALDMKTMYSLVGHMAQMDQPWNCPHGRPTMRHLINLNMIRDGGGGGINNK